MLEDQQFSVLFISWHTDNVLTFSGHTHEAHYAANWGRGSHLSKAQLTNDSSPKSGDTPIIEKVLL